MFIKAQRPMQNFTQARGVTLVELMIAMVIGIIVTGAVISLMVNTLNASTRNIQATQVTQQLRATMEIFSRDLRRAGAIPNVISCYAQNTCNNIFSEVTYLPANGTKTCVIFSLDRDSDGVADNNEWAGFRYGVVANAIEMKVSGAAADDDCSDGNWVVLTDTDVIRVTAFSLDTSPSYTTFISQDTSAGTQSLLQVRKLNISITGELASGGSARTIDETIRLRNDTFITQAIPGP